MIIKSLTIRNALSYGNTPTVIDFDALSGLVSIRGENGAGKTNFIALIGYALFGETPTHTKFQLVNNINQSDFYVNIVIMTVDFGLVEITRTINPDSVKITGENIDKSLQKHGVKKINKFIEDEIVGMSQELFLNTILISASRFKSFLNINASDKTKIIDQLFGTDKFSAMLSLSKKECKLITDEIKVIDSLIADKIKQQEELAYKIKNVQEVNPDDISVKIADIQKEIDELTKTNAENIQSLSLLKQDLSIISFILSKTTEEKNNKVFELNQNKNTQLRDINKACSTESYNIESEINADNKIANDTLFSNYNNSVSEIESSAKSKLDEYKATLDEVKANTRKEYDAAFNSLKLAYDTDKSSIITSCTNKKSMATTAYGNRVTEYLHTIQKIADEIVALEAEIVVHKKTRYNLDMEVGILNNKIKLYDKGQCSECEIDLHTSDFHVKRKQETQIELEQKTLLLKESREIVDRLSDNLKEKQAEKELNNTNLNKEQFKHEADLAKFVADEKAEINALDNKFKDDKQKLINDGVAKVDAAKLICDNSSKIITDEIATKKSILFSDYTKAKESNDSTARAEILSKQNIITEKYAKLIESKTAEFDAAISQEITAFDAAINTKTTELNAKEKEASSYKENIAIAENKIGLLQQQIEVYKLSMKDNSLVGELQKIINELESDVNQYCVKQEALKLKVKDYNSLSFLLDKNGVKQEFLKKILPQFNKTIREVCSKMRFRYQVAFNENFDVKVTWMNNSFEYPVSTGQEAIVNLAIMLASVQMIMMRKNGCNVIFLDELFSHVSPAVIDSAVQMLSEFVEMYGVTIYIVSHTPIPMAHVNSIINVEHIDGFSVMSYEK